jgi:hypothetical protein
MVIVSEQMSEGFKQFLRRIAGDGKGSISEQRLDEWLCRNSGRPVRLGNGRTYQLVRGWDGQGRNTFRLTEVK